MKNNYRIVIGASLLLLAMMYVSCDVDKNLTSALSEINSKNVTQNTINKLEQSTKTQGSEAESCYNLARIYHFNPQYVELEKAQFYYQKVVAFFGMSQMEKQMQALSKKYGVSLGSAEKALNDVNNLICNRAFAECVQENTFAGYARYVRKYPKSLQNDLARDKALDLKKAENTVAGFSEYVKTFPKYRTDELNQLALDAAKRANTYDGYLQLAELFPKVGASNEVKELSFKAAVAQNKYSSFSEFKSKFPSLCPSLEKTIELVEKEPLNNEGKNILRSLKTEYINNSSNFDSFVKAIKKYPIIDFEFDEKYYETQSSYDSVMNELEQLSGVLSPDLCQKLQKEAVNRQKQFVTDDWKYNPVLAKKVVTGYPDLYNTVVDELYKYITKIPDKISEDVFQAPSRHYIANEKGRVEENLRCCNDFVSCFGNTSYVGQVKDKLQALSKCQNQIESAYRVYELRCREAEGKFRQLESYILSHGSTPEYSMGDWERYSDWGSNYYQKTYCKVYVTVNGNVNPIVYIGHYSGRYYLGTSRSSKPTAFESNTISGCIRKWLWKGLNYSGKYYSDYVSIVNFLEEEKNGQWWRF